MTIQDIPLAPDPSFGRLRKLVRACALSLQSLVIRPSKEPILRLLFCHYLFGHQKRQFERTIRYLQGIGEFIGTDRVLDVLHGRVPLQRNAFHLSFDDGLKCVVENAFPVLRELGVPAIMFVPTALVSAPADEYRDVRRALATYDPDAEIVTWDDLAKARAAGFDIGAHSRTHARLSLSLNSMSAIEDEIVGSKEDLERHLGECRYMSWPFGRLIDIEDATLDIVRKAGFQACFGGFRGHVTPGVTDAYRIPRHHFAPEWPLSHVKCFALGAWENR